jgi:hypothetical protein
MFWRARSGNAATNSGENPSMTTIKHDASAMAALRHLAATAGKRIDARELAAAIKTGTSDRDGQLAGREYDDFERWTKAHKGQLTSAARKVMDVFTQTVAGPRAHHQHGVSGPAATKMYDEMQHIGQTESHKTTSPKPKPKTTGGDMRVVNTADNWWHHGHVNPNTGNKEWSGWCLGFVHAVHKAATGHEDPQLVSGTAAGAMAKMKAAHRLHTDWSGMKAGAAIFWGTQAGDGNGHVCIFTGRYDKHGSPICVTTGNWKGANHGVIEEPLSSIERYDGKANGWAQLN